MNINISHNYNNQHKSYSVQRIEIKENDTKVNNIATSNECKRQWENVNDSLQSLYEN